MRTLRLWIRLTVVAWLLGAATAAAAQERDPAGLWALRADGRVLALLELRRDPSAPAAWTGAWTRPERLSIDDAHTVSEIGGAIVSRPLQRVTVRGDRLDLAVPGPSAEEEPIVFSFRLVEADAAELALRGQPIPPMALRRVPAGTTVAADWNPERRYALEGLPRRSNPEMTTIFEADQADRSGGGAGTDWSAVAPRDAARRERTLQLLNAGALQSGDDFWHAAFVFQHGSEPNDFLLAHTLALIATAHGRPDATWIAAATLDRYLQSIGQKQIYGTQYQTLPGQPTTQEPYDRTLISDALREALRVPNQAAQEQRRAELEASYRAREASPQ